MLLWGPMIIGVITGGQVILYCIRTIELSSTLTIRTSSTEAIWNAWSLQSFSISSKHNYSNTNVVVHALSKKYILLSILEARILIFKVIKDVYKNDNEFKVLLEEHSLQAPYKVYDGFIFRGGKLCIPKCPFRELSIMKAHGRSIEGHFGIKKTKNSLKELSFFGSK